MKQNEGKSHAKIRSDLIKDVLESRLDDMRNFVSEKIGKENIKDLLEQKKQQCFTVDIESIQSIIEKDPDWWDGSPQEGCARLSPEESAIITYQMFWEDIEKLYNHWADDDSEKKEKGEGGKLSKALKSGRRNKEDD